MRGKAQWKMRTGRSLEPKAFNGIHGAMVGFLLERQLVVQWADNCSMANNQPI
jgi:hypothetical protein